ncbi:MAG: hypothetical protein DMG97_06475 [Acidobacteria bacterium]|nr:MAG: hypothetical protein DMG97_06475 [Acidobacteriota bacterium]
MSKDKLLYGLIVLAFVVGFSGGIMVGARMENSNLARFTHIQNSPIWEMFDSKTGQSCVTLSAETVRDLNKEDDKRTYDDEKRKYDAERNAALMRGEQPPSQPPFDWSQLETVKTVGPPRYHGMPLCSELIK